MSKYIVLMRLVDDLIAGVVYTRPPHVMVFGVSMEPAGPLFPLGSEFRVVITCLE